MTSRERPTDPTLNERGAALLLALFVLTTLTLVALYLGSEAQINRRIAGDDVSKSRALRYAEAGVVEALARVQRGEGPDPYVATSAQKVVQVLNAASGGVGGPDTTLLATGQPAAARLPYSTSGAGNGALTIEFRTNAARTQVLKYDKSMNPPIQTTAGLPIYRITSTGRAGTISRTIVAEVSWTPVPVNIKGALAAGQGVKFTGNAVSCGYNHRADTPVNTGMNGRAGLGGCDEDPGASPPEWEWPTGTVTGIWSTGDATQSGAANAFGAPALSNFSAGFYAGPWEVLGMTPAQFWTWVGPRSSVMPPTPRGVYYLDNDNVKQNASGAWSLNAGSGFLYVDGDLTLQQNWHGLIYIEGDLKLNSTAWVLGAVIAKGTGNITFNGGATILYSYDAIQQNLGAVSWQKPAMLSWREN